MSRIPSGATGQVTLRRSQRGQRTVHPPPSPVQDMGVHHGRPVLSPFPVTVGNLVLAEVDVFDPQPQTFHQAQPGPIEGVSEVLRVESSPPDPLSHLPTPRPRERGRHLPKP